MGHWRRGFKMGQRYALIAMMAAANSNEPMTPLRATKSARSEGGILGNIVEFAEPLASDSAEEAHHMAAAPNKDRVAPARPYRTMQNQNRPACAAVCAGAYSEVWPSCQIPVM